MEDDNGLNLKLDPNLIDDLKDGTVVAGSPTSQPGDVADAAAPPKGYTVYWQRWLMLFTFCLLSMSNGMAWLTYATNANAAVYYNVTPLAINMMAVFYEAIYIVFALFAGRVTQRLGLRGGMYAGAALNAAGAIIRCLPWPFIDPRHNQPLSYGLAVVGQICCASAQLFTLATPVLIADNWFPPHERVTATGLGALSNQVGLTLAFATAQIVLPKDYSANPIDTPLQRYIVCHGVIMLLASLSVFVFFRSKPPTPPSPSQDDTVATTEEDYDLVHVLSKCAVNWNLWLLLLAFGAAQGTSYAVATLLNSFMSAQAYPQQDINVAGILLTLGGVVSPGLFGYLADKTRRYKVLILISMVTTTAFSVFVPLIDSINNAGVIQLLAFLLGFSMASIIPLALDVSVEVTYPLPPAVTSTLCMIASNGAGLLLTFLIPVIQANKSNLFAGWAIVIYMGISTLLFIPFNARSNRLDVEARALEQSTMLALSRSSFVCVVEN